MILLINALKIFYFCYVLKNSKNKRKKKERTPQTLLNRLIGVVVFSLKSIHFSVVCLGFCLLIISSHSKKLS